MERKIDMISARLSKHPELWNRIDRLLDIVENQDGQATLADDAEERVIGEMRKFGQEILEEWAKEGANRQQEAVLASGVNVKRKSKKTLLVHHLWSHCLKGANFLPSWVEEDDTVTFIRSGHWLPQVFVPPPTGDNGFCGRTCFWASRDEVKRALRDNRSGKQRQGDNATACA